jgi:BirA family biotin operon repressor/biotin-[acetyl-CoA-carboxylase] ligase
VTAPTGWPDGVRLLRHDVLDSTNAEAIRLAQAGERGTLWVMAARQTAGRGRLGRVWISHRGNLFATLLVEADLSRSAQIGFLTGISAVDVIRTYVTAKRVRLKWPNDILIDGCKCAGILAERASDHAVAVGIGIDLVHAPADCNAVSVLSACGAAPEPEVVLNALVNHVHKWLTVWRETGFDALREEWLKRAAGAGEFIRVSTPKATMEGVFQAIDQDGALLLRDAGGICHRVTAADVFYGS